MFKVLFKAANLSFLYKISHPTTETTIWSVLYLSIATGIILFLFQNDLTQHDMKDFYILSGVILSIFIPALMITINSSNSFFYRFVNSEEYSISDEEYNFIKEYNLDYKKDEKSIFLALSKIIRHDNSIYSNSVFVEYVKFLKEKNEVDANEKWFLQMYRTEFIKTKKLLANEAIA